VKRTASRTQAGLFRKFNRLATILLILGSITACNLARGDSHTQPPPPGNQDLIQSLRSLHYDRYLLEPQFTPEHTQSQGWDVYTYPTDQLLCILGSQYFLMARRGTQAEKTVVWLDGGGACYPGRDDCAKEAQFYSWIQDGGLASSTPENPVRDWNFIYIPYCDGSLHMGDASADYDGDGVVDHWHWGLKSTSAALRLVSDLFPDTQDILIAGCSAGGAGTLAAATVARIQFPQAHLFVLNVSGSGLVNPANKETADLARQTWNVEQFITRDCPLCDQQIIYLYAWLLERDTRLKVGLFSSYQDAMTSTGWGLSGADFEALLIQTTAEIHTNHPGSFERFFISGDSHCLGDYSYAVNGITFWEWITYMVKDDARWVDQLE
jgi:hypothetical protein